jgi:hypothetical protein
MKSATPGSAMGRASRPGSLKPMSEYAREGGGEYDDEDDEAGQEELASDYGDNDEEALGAAVPGEEKKVLSTEEERVLQEMGKRDMDMESSVKISLRRQVHIS